MCLQLLRDPGSCNRRRCSQRHARNKLQKAVVCKEGRAYVSIGLSGILAFILSLNI